MSEIEKIREQGKLSEPEVKKFRRNATESEILQAKSDFANKSIEVQQMQSDFDVIKKQYKTSMDLSQNDADTALRIVKTGEIDVTEECEKRMYYEENKVRYFSTVTGEFVMERAMTGDDRQRDLEFDKEEGYYMSDAEMNNADC